MENKILDAIIIGAGQAGLSASYYLKQMGLSHIVFERGKTGESWRSQRWDSFILNSPNFMNILPGIGYAGTGAEGFPTVSAFTSMLEDYVANFKLPVAEHTQVIAVDKNEEDDYFTITVLENWNRKIYRSKQVIISSGSQSEKKIPAFATNLSSDVKQLHASEYRNASQLPEGAVLVVGSGQSGVQVAEDLVKVGRKVYLSTSLVGRVPRRYRGKDCMTWLNEMKYFDVTPDQLEDPNMIHMRPPQITGIDGGRTLSLQSLAKKGVIITGKTDRIEGKNIYFQPNAAMHVQFADEVSKKIKEGIDQYILYNNIEAPLPETDADDVPDQHAACANPMTKLNTDKQDIAAVIWTTGFSGNFNYIKLPVLDKEGNPQYKDGISATPGLYFLGMPWLRSRKSFLVYGIGEDAEFITKKVLEYSREIIEVTAR